MMMAVLPGEFLSKQFPTIDERIGRCYRPTLNVEYPVIG
jgi:hypothetical protein